MVFSEPVKSFRIILTIFFCLSINGLVGQKLTYDVLKDGKKIGEVIASKSQNDDKVHYAIKSSVEVTIFFSVLIESSFVSMYQSGFLQKARTINKRDGKMKEYSSVDWTGEAYDIVRDGKMMTFGIPSQVRSSLNAMYFKEPVGRKKIFSERFGEYVPLRPLGKAMYQIELPGGGSNIYTFKEGYCSHVLVQHWLADVEFVLRSKSPNGKS